MGFAGTYPHVAFASSEDFAEPGLGSRQAEFFLRSDSYGVQEDRQVGSIATMVASERPKIFGRHVRPE